jgi:hypothetical protein
VATVVRLPIDSILSAATVAMIARRELSGAHR